MHRQAGMNLQSHIQVIEIAHLFILFILNLTLSPHPKRASGNPTITGTGNFSLLLQGQTLPQSLGVLHGTGQGRARVCQSLRNTGSCSEAEARALTVIAASVSSRGYEVHPAWEPHCQETTFPLHGFLSQSEAGRKRPWAFHILYAILPLAGV